MITFGKLTVEQRAIQELQDLQNVDDTEYAHARADDVLCGLLEHEGFSGVVEEWKKVSKWYS